MKKEIEFVLPEEIEKRSFEIITAELGATVLDTQQAPVIKRVIHTTADFDYLHTLTFSPTAIEAFWQAVREGATIVTDTNMVKAGISAKTLARYGGGVRCFMAEPEVEAQAKAQGKTRAAVSMEFAAKLDDPVILAIGNAPTALIALHHLMDQGKFAPRMVIGVPVGFVNVVESKELILQSSVPHIVALGRKGGSNVAAAICNALLYSMEEERI